MNYFEFVKTMNKLEQNDTDVFNSHIDSLIIKKSNLYTKKGLDDIPTARLMEYKTINGHCGVFKKDGKYYCGIGNFNGVINAYGDGDRYLCTLENGETFDGVIGKDIVVLWNNNQHKSNLPFLIQHANMLTEIDSSMLINIINSRVIDVPVVATDDEKRAFDNVMKDIEKGKKISYVNSRTSNPFTERTNNDIPMVKLTHPETVGYLQHLSRFHDEWLKRAYLEMGVYISNKDKGAQLTTQELDDFKAYCTIGQDDEFEMLKKFCDDMKKVFDVDVEFIPKSFIQTEKDLEKIEESEGEDDGNDDFENGTFSENEQ